MHILLIETYLADDGAIRSSLERAHHWHRLGARVTVYVLHPTEPPKHPAHVPDGLRLVIGTPPMRALGTSRLGRAARRGWQVAWVGAAFAKALTLAARADVVVSGREMDRGLIVGATAALAARKPFVVSIRSNMDKVFEHSVPPSWVARTRWALRTADLTVALSQDQLPGLARAGADPDRMHVVANGVSTEAVRRLSEQEPEIELPAEPFVVAVGRLALQKGYRTLIRAHARALAGGAQPHALLLLGEGHARPELEALARELGVAGSVRMPGFVHNPYAVVARADLLALSSRWEGFARVLLEALSLGVPIVSTRCVSGPREILNEGRYGALVPVGDADALAGVIADHLNDPTDLRARAQIGAPTVAERFAPERLARTHYALIREAATRGRLGAGHSVPAGQAEEAARHTLAARHARDASATAPVGIRSDRPKHAVSNRPHASTSGRA